MVNYLVLQPRVEALDYVCMVMEVLHHGTVWFFALPAVFHATRRAHHTDASLSDTSRYPLLALV